ncbi:hypothetical protein DESC_660041 [Desulfosarcina cetonica]|nr:hypothetical protein DESC_660041 [Desulfosarcina cetonica]
MADEVTADIGGAALGPVEQGNGVLDSPKHQGCPQRTAEFASIACGLVFDGVLCVHLAIPCLLTFTVRRELPHRAGHGGIDLLGEVEHAAVTGKGQLAFMVVIAKADAELEGHGALLDAADKKRHALFDAVFGELQGVGIIHDDRAVVAHLPEHLVILIGARLRPRQHHIHAQGTQGLDHGKGLERTPHIDGGLFSLETFLVAFKNGIDRLDLFPHQGLGLFHHLRIILLEELGHVI